MKMSHGRTRISMPAILMQTRRVLATFTSQMFSGPPCVSMCVYSVFEEVAQLLFQKRRSRREEVLEILTKVPHFPS